MSFDVWLRGEEDADDRSGDITPEQLQAIYEALVSFVKTEWVEGVCEGNQPCQFLFLLLPQSTDVQSSVTSSPLPSLTSFWIPTPVPLQPTSTLSSLFSPHQIRARLRVRPTFTLLS